MDAGLKTVLVVDDDSEVRDLLRGALEDEGYRILEAENASRGWDLFLTQKPDLVILDLRLPDGDGIEICRKIRRHRSLAATPVIMLTAQGEMQDKLTGFDVGADQFLVKPLQVAELTAWVRALFRRMAYTLGEEDNLRARELIIDVKARLVHFQDRDIANLTVKEFDLLHFLVRKRPQVLSRKFILSKLWHMIAVDRLVDVHISNLRKKLPPDLSARIQTVSGKGFRFFESD